MKFYNALQLDPSILKRNIAACDTRQEKTYYWIAMSVRSVLIVASGSSIILHDAGNPFCQL